MSELKKKKLEQKDVRKAKRQRRDNTDNEDKDIKVVQSQSRMPKTKPHHPSTFDFETHYQVFPIFNFSSNNANTNFKFNSSRTEADKKSSFPEPPD